MSLSSDEHDQIRTWSVHRRFNFNYLRSLTIAGQCGSGICICEDDIVFQDDFVDRLCDTVSEVESAIGQSDFILSAYAPHDFDSDLGTAQGRFYCRYAPVLFFGTQCMYYPRSTARRIAKRIADHGVRRYRKPGDLIIQDYALEQGNLYASTPSLVQHVGAVSTGLSGKLHQSPSFGRLSKPNGPQPTLSEGATPAEHDRIYTHGYFASHVEPAAQSAAPVMTHTILKLFRPTSVVDVGCGTGALLHEFASHANVTVLGLELASAALSWCRQRGVNVMPFDLERDPSFDHRTFDLAICLEVAVHLPADCADRLVALLAGLAPQIIFSAAPPSQGGTDHVNERPQAYWIKKFESKGRHFHNELTTILRREWREANMAHWYATNVMVFGDGNDHSGN